MHYSAMHAFMFENPGSKYTHRKKKKLHSFHIGMARVDDYSQFCVQVVCSEHSISWPIYGDTHTRLLKKRPQARSPQLHVSSP